MTLSETYRTIQAILHDIAHSPDGISTGEIVKKYGIVKGAARKYIRILEDAGVPIYEERKRYYLADGYRVAFTLTPEESELLALALERSLIHHGTNLRIIRMLIHKLIGKMPDTIGDTLLGRLTTRHDQSPSPADRWFTTLAHAKRQREEVWVIYHPLNRPEPTRWKIRPYRFFANPLSDGLYILCDGTQNGASYIPLSLKFDRILEVQPTGERFGMVEAARFAERFGRAWGVWNTTQTPQRVVLRFEPRHYDRLLESLWHPTQQISIEPDGYVLFAVEVADPREMIPWIRSWGAGVVVLEPEDLRLRIIHELYRQMQTYGLSTSKVMEMTVTPIAYLWAKYNHRDQTYHLLLYHLIDVAAVALVMWTDILSDSQRDWLADLLDTDKDTAGRVLAFLVGLHDIGKATPGFQKKATPIYKHLMALNFPDERTSSDTPHGVYSAVILRHLLVNQLEIDTDSAKTIAAALGGHHGTWISNVQSDKKSTGKGKWTQVQAELFQQLANLFDLSILPLPQDETRLNLFTTFLSGLTSVCDWLGSNEDFFAYEASWIASEEYLKRSIAQARGALRALGWLGWRAPGTLGVFDEMFGFAPNPLQQIAIAAFTFPQQPPQPPRMILIEYLTGGGKTELAWYLADALINLFSLAGVYIAMPTQATSNQMFERVSGYLQRRYPDQHINLQLAHAQADHHPLYQHFQPPPGREGNEAGITAEEWFQNRKRALLAPYAVGTVDQAMLSVLQTQHHFVRQYALSHKVVIFDEIHSYDTYMNEIIDRLLEWLTALKSPVILLSATLPDNNRKHLLEQVGATISALPDVPYPRLTIVSHTGEVQIRVLPKPPTRILQLQQIPSDIEALCKILSDVYASGGCVAVICNTVDEAIVIARELHAQPSIDPDDVWLFHARFPAVWRGKIEAKILSSFGKGSQRPARAILVATQIIEQSLDLDFDLIITRVAPIDLLIQRAGRLHRHVRSRPPHLATPILVIRVPDMDRDIPAFGVDEAVYARFILLKTWLVLNGRSDLRLPDEIDELMNFVYDHNPRVAGVSEEMAHALAVAYNTMDLDAAGSAYRGKEYRIGAPTDEGLIGGFSAGLSDEEDRPTTREIRPGVDIIAVSHDPGGLLPTPSKRRPTQEEVRMLLQYRLTVHNRELVEALKALPLNPHWGQTAALRYAREVVFNGGSEARIPGCAYRLRLSKAYGLELFKEDV
jgi:CRISPR-associated endonuclease/helicase Cas3